MQWQHDRPFCEKSVHFPLSASAAPEGASFQGPEKSFLYLRIVRCLIIVDQRAIYSLKFTSEASHSRVSAYSTRLTSQDISQMESLFAGQTGRTNFSDHTYLATCIPTHSNFVVYRLECNFKLLLGNWQSRC